MVQSGAGNARGKTGEALFLIRTPRPPPFFAMNSTSKQSQRESPAVAGRKRCQFRNDRHGLAFERRAPGRYQCWLPVNWIRSAAVCEGRLRETTK
jgi:hypothetical protein